MIPLALTLVQILAPAGAQLDAYGDPLPPGAVARLGSARWRCPDPPEHLIWSPDGKYLVGTHGGKALTIWSYPAGVVVGRFQFPAPRRGGLRRQDTSPFAAGLTPQQVRFSPDSRSVLVYGGENQLFRVYLPEGWSEQLDTGGHRGTPVALSADGGRALLEVPDAGGGDDRWSELSVIDLDRPGRLRPVWNRLVATRMDRGLAGHSYHGSGAAFMTPDGRFAVAARVREFEDRYSVIDLATGRSWELREGVAGGISLSPDGRSFLAAGRADGLTWWEFAEPGAGRSVPLARQVARTSDSHDGPWDFSPDGRSAVAAGWRSDRGPGHTERTIAVLDTAALRTARRWTYRPGDQVLVRKGEVAMLVYGGLGNIRPASAVAPDNRTVAVASSDSPRLRFFDLRTGAELRTFGGHVAVVTGLRFAGGKLISVAADGVGRLWSPGARSSRELEVFDELTENDLPPPSDRARVKVLYDRDRNRVEARDRESEAVVWHQEVPGLAVFPQADRPGSLPIATDRDGERVAFSAGESVHLRDLLTGEFVADFQVPGNWATAVEFGSGADTLVVGYHDGEILVWDLRPADLPRRPPTDIEMESLWADLAGSARAARRARTVFQEHPRAALSWLGANLRPLPRPTEFDIDLWLAQLAHPRFQTREEATRQLVRHFDVAGPAIREMLATTRSPEVDYRLRTILGTHARWGGDGDVVRLVRAVTILERFGTPEAELLLRVARGGGVPAGRAGDALVRIRERGKGRPVHEAKAVISQADGSSAVFGER